MAGFQFGENFLKSAPAARSLRSGRGSLRSPPSCVKVTMKLMALAPRHPAEVSAFKITALTCALFAGTLANEARFRRKGMYLHALV